MRTAPVVPALLLLAGCASEKPLPPPVAVSPAALVRNYRDTPQLAERAWSGRPVLCRLAAGTYTVEARALKFRAADEREPCVAFLFAEPVTVTGSGAVTVCGLCRGVVRDNEHRGAGVEFCVVVTDCRTEP